MPRTSNGEGSRLVTVGVLRPDELERESFEGGVRFATEWADLSRRLGASRLGYGEWRIPPGKVSVPYHYHLVNEELAIVLEGGPSIRLDGREHRLAPGDVVALPAGEDSAHQFLNRSEAPAGLILASTMVPRELVGYPDSEKWLYAIAGLAREPGESSIVVKGDRVLPAGSGGPYLEGEAVDEPPPVAPEESEPDPRIARAGGPPWEPYAIGPYRAERKRLAREAGARRLGYSLYRVASGERPWAYHFHHVNEEAFFVFEGRGALRVEEGEREIGPGDVISCPAGPGGAHALEAIGEDPLVYLALSTMEEPDVLEYPDSGNLAVMVGSAPGGDPDARSVDLYFRTRDAVPAYEGEA